MLEAHFIQLSTRRMTQAGSPDRDALMITARRLLVPAWCGLERLFVCCSMTRTGNMSWWAIRNSCLHPAPVCILYTEEILIELTFKTPLSCLYSQLWWSLPPTFVIVPHNLPSHPARCSLLGPTQCTVYCCLNHCVDPSHYDAFLSNTFHFPHPLPVS